jgi:nitrite reductase/ring-hydroxylating ferredoxin subunit
MAWVSLCDLADLTPDQGKYVEIDGFQLAVFLHAGTVYAMDNECPHAGGAMAGGYVDENACAVCPWHGWAFKLETGELHDEGAYGGGVMIRTYPTRILKLQGRGELVQADLPMP